MANLVWRVKLVAELPDGVTREVEVARLERSEAAELADLGLCLAEAKQLTAALQSQMVSTQVTVMGERCRWCGTCGCVLTQQGVLFRDVPLVVRRCAGANPASADLCLPGFGRDQEFRCARPGRGERRT